MYSTFAPSHRGGSGRRRSFKETLAYQTAMQETGQLIAGFTAG